MGFEAAARLGSFSRAADELSLTQSAISHQVQQLEEQVGQPLFRRVGRGVELTIAGEVLQRSVQRSMDVLRSGLGRISTYLDPGLVVLVCPATVLHGWLQPRLAALQAVFPTLCPMISTDVSARFIDEIDVDIVICDRPLQQTGLLQHPFLHDEWVTVCSPELAQTLSGVAMERHFEHAEVVCLEDDLTRDSTAKIFREQLAFFRKGAIYDDPRLLLDAVLRGRGLAGMSRLLAQGSIDAGHLVVLPNYPKLTATTWWLSRVADTPRSTQVSQWFEWLQTQGDTSNVRDLGPKFVTI